MFTGLIETIGVLKSRDNIADGISFHVDCSFQSGEYQAGESIAVNGVCVTIEEYDAEGFSFTASSETINRSILSEIKVGDRVHLERALRLTDRLGGHIVQGHVDGIGVVVQLARKGIGADLRINIPEGIRKYVVEKGSLAVQGVSLTVATFEAGIASLALIPATLESACLDDLKPGDRVNLEVDILAKYVESLLPGGGGIDEDKLKKWGFA